MVALLALSAFLYQGQLADQVQKWFKEDALKAGVDAHTDETIATFAVLAPGATAVVVNRTGDTAIRLEKQNASDLFAAQVKLPNKAGFTYTYEADGKRIGGSHFLEVYNTPKEVLDPQGGLKGKLVSQGQLESKIFAGTTREWWLYIPPGITADTECALLVSQDGQWQRGWVANALDNMIASKVIPPTVGVFIMPGGNKAGDIGDRSREYDTLSSDYVHFLLMEVLPKVQEQVKLTPNPEQRAIMGLSSGGICSFTACWERPDQFGVCISGIGSFTNIASGQSKREGGHNYEALIRKIPKKPIRIFLQDGANDLDNVHGNWYLANLTLEKSLKFAGYDVLSDWGNGTHSDKHLRSIFPDVLKWWFNAPK